MDLGADARKKGFTVGLSRALLAVICAFIWRRTAKPVVALFYCALAARALPPSMYAIYVKQTHILYAFNTLHACTRRHYLIPNNQANKQEKAPFKSPRILARIIINIVVLFVIYL